MSEKIHEAFRNQADVQASEAFSEVLLRMPDFKVRSPGETGDFPPQPSFLTGTTVAYSEDNGFLHRQFTLLPGSSDDKGPEAIGEAYISSYRREISPVQEIADAYPLVGDALVELTHYITECNKVSRLRTVGNFVLFEQAKDPSQYYSGLVVPKKAYIDIPLVAREAMLRLDEMLKKEGINLRDIDSPNAKDKFQRMITNDSIVGDLIFNAAAVLLPTAEQIEQGVEVNIEMRKKQNP